MCIILFSNDEYESGFPQIIPEAQMIPFLTPVSTRFVRCTMHYIYALVMLCLIFLKFHMEIFQEVKYRGSQLWENLPDSKTPKWGMSTVLTPGE